MVRLSPTASSFTDAVTRLDGDIAEKEAQAEAQAARLADINAELARLRAMRENIEPFYEQYLTPAPTVSLVKEEPQPTSYTDVVLDVFHQNPTGIFDVDDVWKPLLDSGSDATRDQVRNAINYVVRVGKVHRGPRRGTYSLTDTSTPAMAEVDVNGDVVWRPQEIEREP